MRPKVIFINPPDPNRTSEELDASIMPLGLGYLGAVLENNGYEVEVVDIDQNADEISYLEGEIEQASDILCVGLTSTSYSYLTAIAIADRLKKIEPRLPVLMGGCHVSFTVRQTLSRHPAIDIIVKGEGEETVLEVCEALRYKDKLNNIKGIAYREEGRIFEQANRETISCIDKLPLPAYHQYRSKYKLPALITSRGCPGRCIFCSQSAMNQYMYRRHTPERVLREIETIRNSAFSDSRHILICDSTFTADTRRVRRLCRLLEIINTEITFDCHSRADVLSRELLTVMSRAGFRQIYVDIESASKAVTVNLPKAISLNQIKDSVKWASDVGIQIIPSFIVGLPEETETSVQETIHFAKELMQLGAGKPVISRFTPFPGTPVFENREAFGIEFDPDLWEGWEASGKQSKLKTKNLSHEQISQLYMDFVFEVTRINQQCQSPNR